MRNTTPLSGAQVTLRILDQLARCAAVLSEVQAATERWFLVAIQPTPARRPCAEHRNTAWELD